MVAKNPRSTRRYKKAVKDLRAKGDAYCWRPGCGKYLYADLEWPHPLSITLGHLVAIEDGGDPYDRENHAAECIACNMADGARRTNAKRRGSKPARQAQPRVIRTSPHWE
ncbi:hypothetical protein ACFVTX_18145 [Agromyces sp. NPDC058136]|uniref:hypothetical protein n=1 Tax=Agromyces sp. NPDC058136 TaxID=3346354 RepID=UPI0036D97BE5